MRPRSPAVAVTAAIAVLTGAAILSNCGSDDGTDTQAFCTEVAANAEAIVRPPLASEDDIDDTLDLYRDLANRAPIAIEEEWRDLLTNIETVSTVDPADPESVQRTVAVAYATERSAVAVRNWLLTNCGIDLGPVATIAPQDPAATTTLAPGVSTSIVPIDTIAPSLPPDVPPTTPPAQVPPASAPATTAAAG
ncbi:MAG TPA: hypothetical protein VNO51_14710 [Ilumatobacteraceae bacterium]|nr:hypothetical protein [Ilumatobacteraceae bacterium]